jgi:hypothetical protein
MGESLGVTLKLVAGLSLDSEDFSMISSLRVRETDGMGEDLLISHCWKLMPWVGLVIPFELLDLLELTEDSLSALLVCCFSGVLTSTFSSSAGLGEFSDSPVTLDTTISIPYS